MHLMVKMTRFYKTWWISLLLLISKKIANKPVQFSFLWNTKYLIQDTEILEAWKCKFPLTNTWRKMFLVCKLELCNGLIPKWNCINKDHQAKLFQVQFDTIFIYVYILHLGSKVFKPKKKDLPKMSSSICQYSKSFCNTRAQRSVLRWRTPVR